MTLTEEQKLLYLKQNELEENRAIESAGFGLANDDYEGRFRVLSETLGYHPGRSFNSNSYISIHSIRRKMCQLFSFAIPCEKALAKLTDLGPIVELGAGNGYWAHMLRKRGVDINAYDHAVPGQAENHFGFLKLWTEVLPGSIEKLELKYNQNRTLLLCWPDYDTSFAADALKAYKGSTLVYIGESNGCTGDEQFHEDLYRNWEELEDDQVRIPQWDGMHDYLSVWQRKHQSE